MPTYQSPTTGNYIRTIDMGRVIGIDAKAVGGSTPVTPPFLIELMGRKSKSLLLFKNRWTTIY